MSEDDLVGALAGQPNALVLALDGVQDPHNLGACLRTADACGALAVVVPKDRAATLSPVVRKVAAGAAESVPLVTVTNLVRTLKLLKEADLWVTGADADCAPDGRGSGFHRRHGAGPGGGGRWAAPPDPSDLRPYGAPAQLGSVESLNVSVAAGMLMYEVLRQRNKGV